MTKMPQRLDLTPILGKMSRKFARHEKTEDRDRRIEWRASVLKRAEK
jgi:hypothetical protein